MRTFPIAKGNRNWNLPIPDSCTICHRLVVFAPNNTNQRVDRNDLVEIIYQCPNPACLRFLIVTCKLSDSTDAAELVSIVPSDPQYREIPAGIKVVSPKFEEIYKQSVKAQHDGLDYICGPGYRKAFEFLIKDYAKQKASNEEERTQIERMFAGAVVKQYVSHPRIQALAERTLWLGNDETHYLREWQQHDIDDLVSLINLTLQWIQLEHESEAAIVGMTRKPAAPVS